MQKVRRMSTCTLHVGPMRAYSPPVKLCSPVFAVITGALERSI